MPLLYCHTNKPERWTMAAAPRSSDPPYLSLCLRRVLTGHWRFKTTTHIKVYWGTCDVVSGPAEPDGGGAEVARASFFFFQSEGPCLTEACDTAGAIQRIEPGRVGCPTTEPPARPRARFILRRGGGDRRRPRPLNARPSPSAARGGPTYAVALMMRAMYHCIGRQVSI
jgi:hypothetical protein